MSAAVTQSSADARHDSTGYRVNAALVREYAVACCETAVAAHDHLSAKIDTLVLSLEAAKAALERCRCACDLAERMLRFAARADLGDVEPTTLAEAAAAIREVTGVSR